MYKSRREIEVNSAFVSLACCIQVGLFRDISPIMWFFIACAIGMQFYKERHRKYIENVIRQLEDLQTVITSIGVSNG